MQPRNLLLALAAPFCWGTGLTLAKPVLEHFAPLFMMFLVYCVIALFTLMTIPAMPRTAWPKLLIISALSVTIQGALLFSAMSHVDATTANLVLQTQVPAAILMGWLIVGEPLNAWKLAGTAVALVGVAIVIGLPEQKPPFIPVLVIIAAGTIWALGQVLTRKWSVDSGLMVLKANSLFALPQLAMATWLLEEGQWQELVTASPAIWLCFAFITVFGFYLAYIAWFTLLQRVPVDEAAPFILLMTPIGVATAVLWLGETLSAAQVIGGAIMLMGLAIVSGVFGRRSAVARLYPCSPGKSRR